MSYIDLRDIIDNKEDENFKLLDNDPTMYIDEDSFSFNYHEEEAEAERQSLIEIERDLKRASNLQK